MTLLASSRPFWPLFLHVLGAMTLFGAILTAVITSLAAWRRPDLPFLRKATFWALVSGIPDYVVMRVFAEVIRSDEGYKHDLPRWLTLGQSIADGGLLLLLAGIGAALPRTARSGLARDVGQMGLTKGLRHEGEIPRKRGIGSTQ